MKNASLTLSFISSFVIHIVGLLLASTIALRNTNLHRQDLIPISLLDLSRTAPAPVQHAPAPPEVKKTPPPPPREEKAKSVKPVFKNEAAKMEPSTPPIATPVKEEPTRPAEAKPDMPAKTETPPGAGSSLGAEGGGSEARAGNLFSKADVGVVPGSASGVGGGGTAASGLGHGAGAPGLPAHSAPIRTNREAKPVQTVRASYPPMALRMGVEGDVALKIEVDSEGKVTKAEIIKSGGMGFDEEALKAVKLARFEPAQKDGQSVAAEFTYIYRFRLQR